MKLNDIALSMILFAAAGPRATGCAPQDAPAARPWEPALGVAAIRGTVKVEGTPRTAPKIDPSCDPWCAAHCQDPAALGPAPAAADGSLRDAFVWIAKGAEGWKFPVPAEAALLDQKGCVFVPRVLAVRAGQKLVIRNSDGTTHNVKSLAKLNTPFNFTQAAEGSEREVVFARPETMVRLKCDVHTWMSAAIGVLPHPWSAVSGTDGTFRIPGLPAGTYTVTAWHESYGKAERTVEIPPGGGDVPLAFVFTPKAR